MQIFRKTVPIVPNGLTRQTDKTDRQQETRLAKRPSCLLSGRFVLLFTGDRGEHVAAHPGKPERGSGQGLQPPGRQSLGREAQLGEARVGAPHARAGRQKGGKMRG